MKSQIRIEENYSLRNLNTFGLDVKAKYFVSVSNTSDLEDVLSSKVFAENKHFILGGGSNLLFTSDFDGIILLLNIQGIKVVEEDVSSVIVECGAGEKWDDLVQFCVRNKFYGIENLAKIPGRAGAAPVQNIGAYGVEQKDCFQKLYGYNLISFAYVEMSNQDCRFGYRDSVFKNELASRFIVTSIRYKLSKMKKLNISYKELAKEIENTKIKDVDIQDIYDIISTIRKNKLPDPDEIGNTGSFFKNPVVSLTYYQNLKKNNPEIPGYILSENEVKIPAGWLIEYCGWKGKSLGNAGVHKDHALVLVNNNNASGEEILALAESIEQSVCQKFGIALEKEVIVL